MSDKSNRVYEPADYQEIDINGLASLLAEDAWTEEVRIKGLTKDQLYEAVSTVTEDGTGRHFVQQIRPEWATTFFALKEQFTNLINQFKKE